MSTTRKIEGYYDPTQGTKYDEEVRMDLDHADFVKGPNHVPATLIIGGKGYTESELEVRERGLRTDIQCMVNDIEQVRRMGDGKFMLSTLLHIANKYGIKPTL